MSSSDNTLINRSSQTSESSEQVSDYDPKKSLLTAITSAVFIYDRNDQDDEELFDNIMYLLQALKELDRYFNPIDNSIIEPS